ncbi:MAG: metal-dependent hydrolase [Gammaproteobacteria bacterium]|nr:metal-dependent hydrolase [Gammaproteobacteria bacterium]
MQQHIGLELPSLWGGISCYAEQKQGANTAEPVVNASLAAACGTLPDILEPAFHPNHRQLFHSVGFAVLLGYGLYSLWKWQPEDEGRQLARKLGLVIGGAYLVHLAMDASTPKSLPLFGR